MNYQNLIYLVLVFLPFAASQRSTTQCGGNMTTNYTSTELTSPNYPGSHPHNLNCWWNIQSSNNGNIMFVITNLNTERCCDFIEVYDGYTMVAQFRGRSTTDIPIITSGSLLRVRFRSDSSVARTGFRATYKEVNNCGHPVNATDTPTHISTPFYPEPHPPNMDCYWTITAINNRQKPEITFENGTTDPCCDYLEIFDGSTSLGRIKGNISQRTYSATRNKLSVYFHSESSSLRDGFYATIIQHECGGTFLLVDDSIQTISSPNYPNATGHNLNCDYIIDAEVGYQIEVTIEVDTERCCDFVRVREGNKTLGTLRGDVPKSSIVSTGRNIQLRFHTDGSVTSKGFTATIKRVLSSCNNIKVATTNIGQISSPGYPLSVYPNNYRCDWIIQAPPRKEIVLQIVDFLTETCCDYVEIFDGFLSSGKLQGSISKSFSIVSFSNTMRIRLTTDDSVAKKGFSATYRLANNCGRQLTATSVGGRFSTPNYPNDYADNLDCMWILLSTDNTEVFLNITAGETEQIHDYIQVLDGLKPIARFSGVLQPQTFTSISTSFRVYFHSDKSATRNGFTANFEQTCNYYYNVTSSTQFLSSPNYPGRSPHNYKCNYHLIAPSQDQRIQLTVVRFQTESCCDSVQIFDGQSTLLHQLQDAIDAGQQYFSSSNTMRILYKTDGSVASLGFQFSFILASQ